jgi:hypothetical protein
LKLLYIIETLPVSPEDFVIDNRLIFCLISPSQISQLVEDVQRLQSSLNKLREATTSQVSIKYKLVIPEHHPESRMLPHDKW